MLIKAWEFLLLYGSIIISDNRVSPEELIRKNITSAIIQMAPDLQEASLVTQIKHVNKQTPAWCDALQNKHMRL